MATIAGAICAPFGERGLGSRPRSAAERVLPDRSQLLKSASSFSPEARPGVRAAVLPTLVAIFAYAIMAGFFTQSGVILGPAAKALGRSLPDAAPLFSYLLGGNLIGIAVSLGIFAVLTIKRTLFLAYGVMFVGIALLCATDGYVTAALGIGLAGFGGGLGLSAGAITLTRMYATNLRATAFLGTDCAFSVAGFIVPAAMAALLAHGCRWTSGYLGVGIGAALVLAGAAFVRFPETRGVGVQTARAAPLDPSAVVRIGLFGLALSLYLCGQSVFLIWAPSYMQSAFGLAARDAGAVISNFWGPSIFGLIAAAAIVTRVAPRIVLLVSMTSTVGCLVLLVAANAPAAFLHVTLAFGCVSTCMYKLMISVGSEQLSPPPPQLVTFLLVSGSIGGTLAPVVSAGIVRAFGPHAGPVMALGCYAAALAAVATALAVEKSVRRVAPVPAAAAL